MDIRRSLLSTVALALTTTVLVAPAAHADHRVGHGPGTAQVDQFQMVNGRPLENRFPQPEDRHALASGCYTVEASGQGFLARDGSFGAAEAAAPLHFQATTLGTYLLAANEGRDTSVEGAWWDDRSYYAADGTFADAPSVTTEWVVTAAGEDPEAQVNGPKGQDYVLTSGNTTLEPVRFHHVADDDKGDDDPNGTACANWPEIRTNTSGAPAPSDKGAADQALGFFEAHIHGMAFEFLGGEFRCGSPWHKYGVEYALPNCEEDGKPFNDVLEVAVGDGTAALSDYDPVGWPTFDYWPKPRTLTHEQFYYKWLERAYHGGLRIFTNLFVENSALCDLYPLKENSCNEMDSVRLQAKRIHELQRYIDAQNGGPGEGWFRIVTTPAQARRVINDGRLAVVLGIEVSELFDCREILDVPQCTPDQIDARLAEAFDMGVRQMELLNKFDSALAGVTGDGGSTGIVVNQGNRKVTQHYWNMVTCDEVESEYPGHQHDKTQTNFGDDFPDGQEEIDVLAGAVLNTFGDVSNGYLVPAYPPGPHCNTRGLTDLGRQVIRGMYERGMIFDPDHMSALAQRQALDFVEDVLIPEELAAAEAEGRPAVMPSLISSHGWGNDVIYQRIIANGGHVAPRTGGADNFVDRWKQRRDWHDQFAPAGTLFGMGYGADTNGLGGQPGPRGNAAVPVDYSRGWQAPIGDVTIYQQTSGVRTFDINDEGVSHYGLFADWFRELYLAAEEKYGSGAGDRIITDMLNGAEDYLRMWERNVYGPNQCVSDQSTVQTEDLNALIGSGFERFLENVGAPASRDGSAYTYCAESPTGDVLVLDVVFDAAGIAVEIVPSTSGIVVEGTVEDLIVDTDTLIAARHEHDGHLHLDPAALALTFAGGIFLVNAMSRRLLGRRQS